MGAASANTRLSDSSAAPLAAGGAGDRPPGGMLRDRGPPPAPVGPPLVTRATRRTGPRIADATRNAANTENRAAPSTGIFKSADASALATGDVSSRIIADHALDSLASSSNRRDTGALSLAAAGDAPPARRA